MLRPEYCTAPLSILAYIAAPAPISALPANAEPPRRELDTRRKVFGFNDAETRLERVQQGADKVRSHDGNPR
jgi:hypothetical protein